MRSLVGHALPGIMATCQYWTSYPHKALGHIVLIWDQQGVFRILLCENHQIACVNQQKYAPQAIWTESSFDFALDAMLLGLDSLQHLGGLGSLMRCGTAFQQQVWQEIALIPAGQTLTYQQLAKRLGRVQWARAVGQACARNPLALLIPCHRVVSRCEGLGGYAWGLERKAWLLQHERRLLSPSTLTPSVHH